MSNPPGQQKDEKIYFVKFEGDLHSIEEIKNVRKDEAWGEKEGCTMYEIEFVLKGNSTFTYKYKSKSLRDAKLEEFFEAFKNNTKVRIINE